MAGCAEGKSVAELCALGDDTINALLSKVYKGKKMEKGIAFPTCISINNCCGHFSPLKEDSVNFKKGDVAKMYADPPIVQFYHWSIGILLCLLLCSAKSEQMVPGAVTWVRTWTATLLWWRQLWS